MFLPPSFFSFKIISTKDEETSLNPVTAIVASIIPQRDHLLQTDEVPVTVGQFSNDGLIFASGNQVSFFTFFYLFSKSCVIFIITHDCLDVQVGQVTWFISDLWDSDKETFDSNCIIKTYHHSDDVMGMIRGQVKSLAISSDSNSMVHV